MKEDETAGTNNILTVFFVRRMSGEHGGHHIFRISAYDKIDIYSLGVCAYGQSATVLYDISNAVTL